MKSIFKKILSLKRQNDRVVIVSGLPRSGTSMMMQMLEAGGMPIMTDHARKADEDNPRGYYEFERVKKINEDASWLENCYGKAFKMVSALLYYLPKDKKYKVIFMRREMEEMLASQNVMLQRLERRGGNVSDKEMADKLEEHLRKVEGWLTRQNNMEVLYINYNEIVHNPHENARRVSRFLENSLHENKMARIVEKSLYRQRKKGILPNS